MYGAGPLCLGRFFWGLADPGTRPQPKKRSWGNPRTLQTLLAFGDDIRRTSVVLWPHMILGSYTPMDPRPRRA